jgi:hypothetical protein
MSGNEILIHINETQAATRAYLDRYPRNPQLTRLLGMLDEIETMVRRGWPLSPDERKRVAIGVYGARNLEELDAGALVSRLSRLDAALKQD